VTWDGHDDPENPKHWTQARKSPATLLISCFALVTLMSSAMIALIRGTDTQLVLSAFVHAYAFTPMFFGPLSEILGMMRVLQV